MFSNQSTFANEAWAAFSLHATEIKTDLTAADFTVALPVTTKQIGKIDVIVEQLLLPMGQETKAEAERPGPARSSVPFANGPLSLWVQQGTTWCHFYEMLCFPDPRCLSVAERRGCIHSPGVSGQKNEATSNGAQILKPRLLKKFWLYFNWCYLQCS